MYDKVIVIVRSIELVTHLLYIPWLLCLCGWVSGRGLHWWDHRCLCVCVCVCVRVMGGGREGGE